VEKKMGFDGNRTLIHSGFLDWCNDGSIFEQDISEAKLPVQASKRNHVGSAETPPNFRNMQNPGIL
jgi:hypothetical protein